MPETDYLRDNLLEVWVEGDTFPVYANLYVGLLNANPTSTGDMSSEITGSGYTRKPVTVNAGPPPYANTNEIIWNPTSLWNDINYTFLADSSQGGNMLNYDAITTIATPSTGTIIRIQVGNLTIT